MEKYPQDVFTVHNYFLDYDPGRIVRRGGEPQGVAVLISAVSRQPALTDIVKVGMSCLDKKHIGIRHVVEHGSIVGRALAGVRPGALGLRSAGYGPHLRLVGRARRQARHADGRCRRGQQADLGGRVVGVAGIVEFVQRPGVYRSASGHLDAVLHLVAGDGQAVGRGGGPGHVQGRGGRLAELRAGHGRRSGQGGLDVGHVDGHTGRRRLALHRPVHIAGVGARGLVVQGCACLDADLAG